MEKKEFEALVAGPNRVVVHVPGRRFPGVVIQGDTLFSFYGLSSDILGLLEAGKVTEALDRAEMLKDDLRDYLEFYESVLKKSGLDLPYFRDESSPL